MSTNMRTANNAISGCNPDPQDPNVLICSAGSSTTYIKNISTYPKSQLYVPAYERNKLPQNCTINNSATPITATCLEYTNPSLIGSNSNINSYYISTLKQSGNYWVQDVPQSDQTIYNNLVFNNTDTISNTDAPMCLLDQNKCSVLAANCTGICPGISGQIYTGSYTP